MREYIVVFREGLGVGLRKDSENRRNTEALVESIGAIPIAGCSVSLDDLTARGIDTTGITEVFPFPQLFVLKGITLVCGKTTIYQLQAGTLTAVLSGLTPGSTWTVADYDPYLVMTNGAQLVTRDAVELDFSVYHDCCIPQCLCLCDVNGQMIVGAPGVNVGDGFAGV